MATNNSQNLLDKLGSLWCRLMHNKTMWPIHGHYQCGTCLRYHRVCWAQPEEFDTTDHAHAHAAIATPARAMAAHR